MAWAYETVAIWLMRPLSSTRILSASSKPGKDQANARFDTRRLSLPCGPFCEVNEHPGHDSALPLLWGFFSAELLEARRRMTELPDIIARRPAGVTDRV
jgi:hypothetical protein